MKKIYFLIMMVICASPAAGQAKKIPMSELQQVLFLPEVHGMTAMMRNPAGLSVRPADDGAFFNYNFLEPGERGEMNFTFTMKNLAFGFQQFSLDDDIENDFLRTYRLGISVGGKVLSIGTSNKIIELQSIDHFKRIFSVDAGLIFQPVAFFGIAAFARDLDEPSLEDYKFRREYSVGFSLRILDQRFKISSEAVWNDSTRYLEQARFKAGLSIVPIPNVELLVGGILTEGINDILFQNEQFFAIVQIPFFGGIRMLATARIDGKKRFQRYSGSLLIPLRTVTF